MAARAHRGRRRLLAGAGLALASLLALGSAAAKPTRFTLTVSPQRGTPDDTFVVTVHAEVRGVSGPQRYWHPGFAGLEIVDSKSNQSTSMLFDPKRGQELRTTDIRRYYLRASHTGRYVISPARILLHGVEYETRSAYISVRGSGGKLPTSSSAGGEVQLDVPGFVPPQLKGKPPEMFLHVVVDKREPFVGEQVTVTWLLYTRSDVLAFEPRPPTLADVWSEPLYEPRRRLKYIDTSLGGASFLMTVVSKRALFATKSGKITVPPFRARVSSIATPVGQTEDLASASVALRARPLPSGAPRRFDPSYVGVFDIETSVDRDQIAATDSITLTVTVRGEGALRRTSAPSIAIKGFKVNGPRDDQVDLDRAGDRVRGQRVYRYWLVPERGGDLVVPAIKLAYFDPASGRYLTAKSQPIAIAVTGDPGARKGTVLAGGLRENVILRDVRPSRAGAAISDRVLPRIYRTAWFWGLMGLPLTLFLSLVLTDKLRESLRKETPRSRLRRARGRARQRLRVAEIHLRGNRAGRLFAELSNVLYEHVEERVGEPIQSMTSDQRQELLLAKGFPKTTIDRLEKEISAFDFARFAPTAAGPGEMRAALRRVRELLREIERIRVADQEDVA